MPHRRGHEPPFEVAQGDPRVSTGGSGAEPSPPKPLDPLEVELPLAPPDTADKSDPGRDLRERERAALGELAEVERALAVLESRNPDAAVSVAYAKMLAEARRREIRKSLVATQRALAVRRRWRIVALLFAGAAIFLVGVGSGRVAQVVRVYKAARSRAADAADKAADAFRGAGFTVRELHADGDPHEVLAPEGTCVLAIAASAGGPAHVRITRGAVALEGETSAAFCACAEERASLSASGLGAIELRVLTAPASAIGGIDRLQALEPRPAALPPSGVDRACSDAAFEAWAKSATAQPPAALSADEQAVERQGLAAVAQVGADRPFVAVPAQKDGCFLAVSRGRDDVLALRKLGGERLAAPKGGAVGACAHDLAGLTVWREGRGVVTVFVAPRDRLGGALGLRELGARVGAKVRPWVPSDELAADARAALGASGLASLAVEGGDAATTPLLVLSTDARSTFAPTDVGIESACSPAPEVGATQTFCAEGAPGAVGRGALPNAFARARRPLWLPAPAEPGLPDLERTVAVTAFARRMSLLGFELTVLAGATPTPTGAAVTGRSGEHEVVAVVVSSEPPYLHTLAPNGATWALAGEPAIVALAPGATVELKAEPAYAPHKVARREILVWRR